MKRLITVKEIEALAKQGQKTLCVDESVIVTAAAMDAAKSAGIVITTKTSCNTSGGSTAWEGEITGDMIYSVVEKMLGQVMNNQPEKECSDKPYSSENHENGLKLVRGKSVKMDFLETGTPGAKAHFQEVITTDDGSHVGAGFLEIDDSSFEWTLEGYEEIDYVIEGTLTISINDKTFTAKAGDVFFVPSGAKVVWGSPDKAKVFFTTFAVN